MRTLHAGDETAPHDFFTFTHSQISTSVTVTSSLSIPDEDWRRFFEVNVLSGVRLSNAYLEGMKRKNLCRIVFISSESGVQILAEMIHYDTT
jgi:NAD(P)-dependent dehydrogenase (short-subunit alcohol dehydrogenase family)